MLKLYKLTENEKEYWETWDNDNGTHTVHWGRLGTEGDTKIIKSSFFKKAEDKIQKEIDALIEKGYRPIELDDHYTLLIEYTVEGMGNEEDVKKRHKLEDKMNEILGWSGLGECDGGSIGSGTMEVCNFVVDFKIAKEEIEKKLNNTKYSNYTRIYDENA